MGVIYKLKNEVVDFIISQRQSNPLYSCRQLAESASQKFGLQLSKSSVHDVLKESGIITPRGRKPKDKFEIPQEKKKQIQVSLSQVKLLPAFIEPVPVPIPGPFPEPLPELAPELKLSLIPDVTVPEPEAVLPQPAIPTDHSVILSVAKDLKEPKDSSAPPQNDTVEVSPEHEGAGKIFLKAALWDLGIFSEENIKPADWDYYLTYTKGIKIILENNKEFFIEISLPIERCIREMADGLINNVKPLIVDKVSDKELFRACMEAQEGFKINNISIVERNTHNLIELCDIMEFKREFISKNRIFLECNEKNILARARSLFFSQNIENNSVIDNIMNIRGFETKSKDEIVVNLIVEDSYENKTLLQEAADKLNGMFIRDEENRLVKVVIQTNKELSS